MGNVKIISASAGSGKTYRLAYQYVKSVVADPVSYRRILAVTFTNKATEEMSSRILERLHELATPTMQSQYMEGLQRELSMTEAQIRKRALEAQRNILHDYSRFAVLTIDRFFQRLVRGFMRELGVDAGFNLELETDSLLEQAADALIEASADDAKVRQRVFAAARDRLDEGRKWDVREPLVALGRELFGEEYRRAAVSDQTESLIERVVREAAEAMKIWRAQAVDLQKLIADAGLTPDDFKGRSRGLTAWVAKAARGEFVPLSAAAREAADSSDPAAWTTKANAARVAPHIASLRSALEALGQFHESNRRLMASAALLRENHHNFLLLSDLQQQIEAICRDENIVPISETNRMIARLVGGNDTPFIFERVGSWFTRFFIDEFQDTSHSQWENFVPLLRNAIASEPDSPVMLIGDIKQAIYRWRGSDWRILSRRVAAEMGADRIERETLAVNHRSLANVVEFNNLAVGEVVRSTCVQLDTLVASAAEEGAISSDEAAELTGMLAEAYENHEQTARPDADGGQVTLTVYEADAEGVYTPPVIERIEELQSRGYRARDIAVLVRSNTQGARIAEMLLERKRQNPDSRFCYDVVTQDALTVGGSAASRFLIACLSLAIDPRDAIQRAVLNRWLGRAFDEPMNDSESAFFARIAALSPEEAFEEIVVRFGLADRNADVAYIQAVHQQITSFAARHVADIPLFVRWWNERGARASISMQQGADAISVTTIHKAKGLQYQAVIIPWLSWSMAPETRGKSLVLWADGLDGAGAVPINYREAMADSCFAPRYFREQVMAAIDSANLFYVAVTRAERELHLMCSDNPRDGRASVGNLLRNVLSISENFTSWGAPTPPKLDSKPTDSRSVAMTNYPTSRPGAKVRLRLPSSRYVEDADGVVSLSPRDFGVLMHRAFEHAATVDDVRRAIVRMSGDALINEGETAHLQDVIERAWADPLVAGWFDGSWTEVRNEGEILTPAGSGGVRRPDRVMVREGVAVVVDYKFGQQTMPRHATQLLDYMQLMRAMGCQWVEGYLWYVTLGQIVPVSL